MTSSTFLQLTNKILGPFNEVQLTTSNFASATGFQLECQNYVNQAIFDIYTLEDTKWPFLWSTTTLNTVIGQTDYTRTDGFSAINWQTFRIQRPVFTLSSLTQTTGTVTGTTSTAHNLLIGDVVIIDGATPDDYNGPVTIVSVPTTLTFTYTITNTSAASPATGTIKAYSDTVQQSTLQLMGWEQYKDQKYWDTDQNVDPTGYGLPKHIVRKPDNNIYIGNIPPDRVYVVYYEGWTIPAPMSLYTDTHLIPVAYEQVIVDKAMHYAYMFRDNVEEAALVQKRYEENVFKMRRILIPQETYALATD